MNPLLERFLRYVRIDTQSDEDSRTSPSTAKQLDLCRLLEQECREMGLADVSMADNGIVIATVPSTVPHDAPVIVWNAHVDTSPECSGTNINPIVHENYSGQDIPLPGDPSQVITVAKNPELSSLVGGTIVTTDGTTLLGSDSKSGVAEIMQAAKYLVDHPDVSHGPIRLCFTVDEEIGRGIDGLDFKKLGGVCGYTLDSGGSGVIDCETFSADQAIITVKGVNTHPSIGKGVMINAVRIVSKFIAALPTDRLSPESTDGRDGFLHPYSIEGGVAAASCKLILRDFETSRLEMYAELLEDIRDRLALEYPEATIDVDIHKQYRNMKDGLDKEPRAVQLAIDAVRAAGMEPKLDIIRGGTDGALMTEQGLPTPNLSAGQHNPHSPQEWTSLEEMQRAVDVLIELAKIWGRETVADQSPDDDEELWQSAAI